MVSMIRASEIDVVEFPLLGVAFANETGGRTHSVANRGENTEPDECDCAELEGLPCWECVRTGRKGLPNDSE